MQIVNTRPSPVSTKPVINAPAIQPGRFVPEESDGETGITQYLELHVYPDSKPLDSPLGSHKTKFPFGAPDLAILVVFLDGNPLVERLALGPVDMPIAGYYYSPDTSRENPESHLPGAQTSRTKDEGK